MGDEPLRGRPRGGISKKTKNILNSIVGLALKHDLDPRTLIDSFTISRIKGESKHGNLTVKCRKLDQNHSSFIVLCDDEAVWQYGFDAEILNEDQFFKSIESLISPQIHKQDKSVK